MIRKQIMSLLLSLVMLISVFDIDVHAADVSNGNKGDKLCFPPSVFPIKIEVLNKIGTILIIIYY